MLYVLITVNWRYLQGLRKTQQLYVTMGTHSPVNTTRACLRELLAVPGESIRLRLSVYLSRTAECDLGEDFFQSTVAPNPLGSYIAKICDRLRNSNVAGRSHRNEVVFFNGNTYIYRWGIFDCHI